MQGDSGHDGSPPSQELDKILDKLPPDELDRAFQRRIASGKSRLEVQSTSISQSALFAGPLPSPNLLDAYDAISPGFAERIVLMAENEQEHRHKTENTALTGSVNAEKRGQWFAFVISLIVFCGSIFLISQDHEISGTILAGGSLTGLAYIFIRGRRQMTKDKDTQ